MKVLITGNRGFVGDSLSRRLATQGVPYVGVDIKDGVDLVEPVTIEPYMGDVDVVVHLAAEVAGGHDTIERNVSMLSHVLSASRGHKVCKVINVSSVDALGVFKGQGPPDYFPIDEDHPCTPRSPYGISKRLGELLCAHHGSTRGLHVISLRPPGIWDSGTYRQIAGMRASRPGYEFLPYWEYGAFIDLDDLLDLFLLLLTEQFPASHEVYNVCSDDLTTSGETSLDLCRRLHPGVIWKDTAAFEADPYRTVLTNDRIKRDFPWTPKRLWKDFAASR